MANEITITVPDGLSTAMVRDIRAVMEKHCGPARAVNLQIHNENWEPGKGWTVTMKEQTDGR